MAPRPSFTPLFPDPARRKPFVAPFGLLAVICMMLFVRYSPACDFLQLRIRIWALRRASLSVSLPVLAGLAQQLPDNHSNKKQFANFEAAAAETSGRDCCASQRL